MEPFLDPSSSAAPIRSLMFCLRTFLLFISSQQYLSLPPKLHQNLLRRQPCLILPTKKPGATLQGFNHFMCLPFTCNLLPYSLLVFIQIQTIEDYHLFKAQATHRRTFIWYLPISMYTELYKNNQKHLQMELVATKS